MQIMDKAALLALFAPKIIEVDVPGIGLTRLRELSAPEVNDAREACAKADKSDFGLYLIIASVVDADDKPLFARADLDDLRKASQRTMGEMVTAVMEINGFQVKDAAPKN
jgi:hypothetical protein